VPLFTLANVEPNPLQTVCEVIPDLAVQGVGPTDAYLYVAMDPNPADPGAPWPTDLDTGLPDTCGTAELARWTVNGVGYLAAVAIGEQASQADRDAVLTAFEELTFTGDPQPSHHTTIGFVVAAGVEGGTPWRLEAGPNLACPEDAACAVSMTLVWAEDGMERTTGTLPPILGAAPFNPLAQRIGDVTLSFGAASSNVRSIGVETTDGRTVNPEAIAWPGPLQAFASPTAPIDGTIWWAVVPGVSSVEAVLDDGTTAPGGPVAVSGIPPAGTTSEIEDLRLDTRMEGDEEVASGDGWEIGIGPDPSQPSRIVTRVVVDGEESYLSIGRGSGTTYATGDGALFVSHLALGDGPPTVTLDATGETLVGRWLPGPDQMGKEGRWWVLPLPGAGSGLSRSSPGDLPIATSWPPGRDPAAGVVAAAGSFDGEISWKIAYTSPECLVVAQVAGVPSIGATGCLQVPAPGERLISLAAGRERSLIALVGPAGLLTLNGLDPNGASFAGQCSGSGGFDDGVWADNGICVAVIPNDVDIAFRATSWDLETREEVPAPGFTTRVSDGQLFVDGDPV
jgi:hypothetical protein